MNPRTMLAGVMLVSAAVTAGQAARRSPGVVGHLRFHEFASRTFGNGRMLRVLVPPGSTIGESSAWAGRLSSALQFVFGDRPR